MKSFSFIILLLSHFCSFSQNLENTDKIKLFYSTGSSSWGSNRVFSRSEILELTKNENNDFVFEKYLKINDKVKNQKITKDTIEIKKDKNSIISKNDIENLLAELNKNRENFSSEFLKAHFVKPTKKEILKIAKQNHRKDFFINDYEEKTDFEKRFSDIQNYKKLHDFVNSHKVKEHIVYIDAWNFLRLFVYQKQEIKMYEFGFLTDFGQPISVYTVEKIKEKSNNVTLNHSSKIHITNFNINLLLLKILPERTRTVKMLDINKIRDEYIIWYLNNLNTGD